jgi:GGDEF domain-containing protein
MPDRSLYDEGNKVLTADAFAFVLDSELKRAVRSQNCLTLVTVEASREWESMTVSADEGTLQKVAEIIVDEVRGTDLIGRTENGILSLALIDADFEHSSRVIERLISRIDHHAFPAPLRLAVGAASYPMHAVDAESLKRQALAQSVVKWRAIT